MKKRKIGKWILLGAGVLFLVFVVPVMINESYKAENGYVTLWGASDVLSFYGMILAAVGTGAGVFLSIKHSQKQYQEDKRHRVLPFFSINQLHQEKSDSFVQGLFYDALQERNATKREKLEDNEGLIYKEYPVEKVFFFIEESGITCSTEIDEERKKKAETNNDPAFEDADPSLKNQYPIYLPLILKNVGNGCAIFMRVSVNGGEEFGAYSPPVPVAVNESFRVWIYAERKESLIGRYPVIISYQDIYGNNYDQNGAFEIYRFLGKIHGRLEIETNEPQKLIWRAKSYADAGMDREG